MLILGGIRMATATPLSAAEIAKQMAANSAAWKTATPQMQAQLHDQNLDLAKQTGQTYSAAQGTYSAPKTAMPSYETQSQSPPSSGIPMSLNGTSMATIPNAVQQATSNGVKSAGQAAAGAQPVSAQQTQQSYQPPDYAALAAARTALALQQKQTIANQQKQSAQTAYDQQNLRTKDDRVLGDFSRTQTANPFANMGRKSFQEGLIGRERTQQDADASAALATQKGNIDQMLADYQNATADEQVRIADELKRADRDYNLQLAQTTGTLQDGTRTLAGQTYDWNTSPNNPSNQGQVLQNQGQAQQNLLNQYKIDSYPAEQQANATKVQQELAAGKLDLETAKYNFEQLKDPNSTTNQANKIDLQLKQLDLKNAPEKARLEFQQLQKQIAEIGKVHYKPQTATEIEMDKVNLQTAQEKLKQLQNPTSKAGTTAEEYASNLKPQYDSDNNLTNAQNLEDQIILSGLSDYEQFKLYKKYGLTWDDPIPTK